ncbi:Peroxidase 12, partial [Dichanthelium oligosanthes]
LGLKQLRCISPAAAPLMLPSFTIDLANWRKKALWLLANSLTMPLVRWSPARPWSENSTPYVFLRARKYLLSKASGVTTSRLCFVPAGLAEQFAASPREKPSLALMKEQLAFPTVWPPESATRSAGSPRPLLRNMSRSVLTSKNGEGRMPISPSEAGLKLSVRPRGTWKDGPPARLTASRVALHCNDFPLTLSASYRLRSAIVTAPSHEERSCHYWAFFVRF